MEDNNSKIERIVKEAKDLINIFEEFKQKAEVNNNSNLLKYMDRVSIAKSIVPFLELKDLVNLRSTCKDMNAAVSSTVAIVSYYKSVNTKRGNSSGPNLNLMLRAFGDLNDTDDIQAELESLKNVSLFFLNLDKRFFNSETIPIRINY